MKAICTEYGLKTLRGLNSTTNEDTRILKDRISHSADFLTRADLRLALVPTTTSTFFVPQIVCTSQKTRLKHGDLSCRLKCMKFKPFEIFHRPCSLAGAII